MKKKTVILIPSLNPNEILLDYVKELISTSKSVDVIVVNDGSKENLKYIFDKLEKLDRCVVLTHAINLGKGRALKNGFNYFINNYSFDEVNGIITADSDGQHSVKDVCYKSQLASDADKIYVPHQCIAGKTGFLIS